MAHFPPAAQAAWNAGKLSPATVLSMLCHVALDTYHQDAITRAVHLVQNHAPGRLIIFGLDMFSAALAQANLRVNAMTLHPDEKVPDEPETIIYTQNIDQDVMQHLPKGVSVVSCAKDWSNVPDGVSAVPNVIVSLSKHEPELLAAKLKGAYVPSLTNLLVWRDLADEKGICKVLGEPESRIGGSVDKIMLYPGTYSRKPVEFK
jgi:hypothetical protein